MLGICLRGDAERLRPARPQFRVLDLPVPTRGHPAMLIKPGECGGNRCGPNVEDQTMVTVRSNSPRWAAGMMIVQVPGVTSVVNGEGMYIAHFVPAGL